jgi:hypothetical protein
VPPSWSAASQLANLIKLRPYPPVGTFEICRDVCPVVAIGEKQTWGGLPISVAIDPLAANVLTRALGCVLFSARPRHRL